jgi:hypothetical protein
MQSEYRRHKASGSGPGLEGSAKKWKARMWIRAQLSWKRSNFLVYVYVRDQETYQARMEKIQTNE